MKAHYLLVAERAGHRCEYCRAPEVIFNFPFEVEHVIPASRGGDEDDSNEALACRSCNLFKSDYLTGDDPMTAQKVTLFNPRCDRWDEHFQVQLESAMIEGLTPTGRATVHQLHMNGPLAIAARRIWMRLGLFP